MNYIVSAAAVATALPVAKATAGAVEPAPVAAPQAASVAGGREAIAWIRAMRGAGWIFRFKAENYRGGQVVAGDPLELDDYALCRPAPGQRDDTEQLIAALRHQEQWRSMKANLRTADRENDPIFAAIEDYERASVASVAATERLDNAAFAASDQFGLAGNRPDLDWYERAGLGVLKAEFDHAREDYRRAWNALPNVAPTTLAGATAIVELVLREADMGLDVDDQHIAMLRNALRVLPVVEARSNRPVVV